METAAEIRKRKARAAWAYSGLDQRPLATAAGLKYDRLRKILSTSDPAAPDLDELRQLAEAAGLPVVFTEDAWHVAADRDDGSLSREISELRTGVAQLLAVTAQHSRELQELRASDRRRPPEEGAT